MFFMSDVEFLLWFFFFRFAFMIKVYEWKSVLSLYW